MENTLIFFQRFLADINLKSDIFFTDCVILEDHEYTIHNNNLYL